MSEWGQDLAHRTWTEDSPSVPHSLQVGLLLNPITYSCLVMVLCPVGRPVTTLDCVLVKDSNWAFAAGLGCKINFLAWHTAVTCALFTVKCSAVFGTVLLLVHCLQWSVLLCLAQCPYSYCCLNKFLKLKLFQFLWMVKQWFHYEFVPGYSVND
jgi:hypothetical protein